MTQTRCKFQVSEVARVNWGRVGQEKDAPFIERIKLTAVYDDGLSKENASFASATPSGDLSFTVSNPRVIGTFEPGDYYYLDLIPVPVPVVA